MSALSDRFNSLTARGEKALVTFVTAGDPPLDQLGAVLDALTEAGADVIELGIPFSDPIADGPTIQASSQRALDCGVTPLGVLEALRGWTSATPGHPPIVLMGYYNPLLRIGLERFARLSAEAGASATIISDLTPEESEPWLEASRMHGLDNVFLAAPTSTDARVAEVARRSTGFVYAVSRTGVTGTGTEAPPEVKSLVMRIKQYTQVPVCVGFGISKPEHVRMVVEHADGAVVGSFLVSMLAESWNEGKGRSAFVEAVRGLKAATR